MSDIDCLNARVEKLLCEAVQEVLEVVKETVSEYQEKTARTQRENQSLKRKLQELQEKLHLESNGTVAQLSHRPLIEQRRKEKLGEDFELITFDKDIAVQVKAACDVEMKFDEKVISYFESCTSPVDKEGYLSKKGERKTSYHKRWCVLKGNLLFYKDRPADRDLTGVIVLEGCTVQLCESEEQFAFSLVWSDPGLRTYKFSAEDQASQESWIKALLSANHNYLTLLVMDLEKKYRDALVEFPNEPTNPFTMPNFNTAEAFQGAQSSAVPSFPAAGVAAGAGLSSNQMLQAPTLSSRSANKRSPKLWPKRSANVVPVNTPAAAAPKKAKRRQQQQGEGGSSNVFSMFEQSQIQEYKEAFTIIDQNRDGIISKDDLRDVLATMGQLNVKNEELEAMVKEASGPINFTVFLTMFGEKLKGADPEDVIVSAFKVLDPEATGSIKKEFLEELLTTQCDRFTGEEMTNLWAAFPPDVAGNVDYKSICYVITHGEEKEE
ncbi:hypothetical protein KUCAC02_027769 [Chaenocephalus aceratus]|uniref:Uncharacterized protein n=1 Tax=Chaenocephalus aceratus TaxID=36190 RepID=A0ACB9W5Y6_CHAAC|nr:hypothetical protein KUCAC02_027769 [Chaenocephalus aceratus]